MATEAIRDLFAENPMFVHTSRRSRKYVRLCTRIAGYFRVGAAVLVYFIAIASLFSMQGTDWIRWGQFGEAAVVGMVMTLATHAAIAGEREMATWEALLLTRLTVGQILSGLFLWRCVLAATVVFLFAIPLALVPLMGLGHAESWGEWFDLQVRLVVWAVFLCGFGLFVSARCHRAAVSASVIGTVLVFQLVLIPVVIAMSGMRPGTLWFEIGTFFHPLPSATMSILPMMTNDYDYYSDVRWHMPEINGVVVKIGTLVAATVALLWSTAMTIRRQEAEARKVGTV